ncbi:uncharacterized protein HfgLR_20765 (plasmid) [Haloferax gibbonsii]|uniref:Uncharacterized protein n=1 Tax=Haloferax gibbonsii TaxID=35746 RepID=A0A871BL35_HALGI|nr:uncharacterized protein HfgLR_20765 [Haloferax gibbonsii]
MDHFGLAGKGGTGGSLNPGDRIEYTVIPIPWRLFLAMQAFIHWKSQN